MDKKKGGWNLRGPTWFRGFEARLAMTIAAILCPSGSFELKSATVCGKIPASSSAALCLLRAEQAPNNMSRGVCDMKISEKKKMTERQRHRRLTHPPRTYMPTLLG
jgi:hypothetical protein